MAEYINETEVLQRALGTYGSVPQITMVFEEMSELQKELCKYLRGRGSFEHIAEEIADVEIMLEQMKMLFCCAEDVRNERRRKVERLKERLDNGTLIHRTRSVFERHRIAILFTVQRGRERPQRLYVPRLLGGRYVR